MINYLDTFQDLHYYYDNIVEAVNEFKRNTTNENKEDLIFAIGDMQKQLSTMKAKLKNIYIPKERSKSAKNKL